MSEALNVDPILVMDELAAQRNKLADDIAVARAYGAQMKRRCDELVAENDALKLQIEELARVPLDTASTDSEGATDGS